MKSVILGLLFLSFSSIYPQSLNLRDTTNQFDYIIITTPELSAACQAFMQHKEIVRDFRMILADTAGIFEEFNSSPAPEQNIREFISYAGTYWRQPFPKYVLIIGNNTKVPGFLTGYSPYEFYTDFYYGKNIYENDSTTTEFFVGRLPVLTSAEAENILFKIIEYESGQLQDWMNNVLAWHDYGYFNFPFNSIFGHLPEYVRKFKFVSEPDSSFYGNKDSIFNFTEQTGASVIFFSSANSADSFYISPTYFHINDVPGFNNEGKYFFSMHLYQRNLFNTNTSYNREILVLPSSGSIGSIGFQGSNLWGITVYIYSIWLDRLFMPEYKSLGEVFNMDQFASGFYLQTVKSVNLWADPSLILKYDMTTGTGDQVHYLPEQNVLNQNYPNPFNPVTKIKYSVPEESYVRIKIFDILGSEIETLVDAEKPAGNYEITWSADGLPSGVYLCRMQTGSFIQTMKMLFMK